LQGIGRELFSALYNNGLGAAIGGRDSQGDTFNASQMRTIIAYSALDSGYEPFGTTAIQSLYNDADTLGTIESAGEFTGFVAPTILPMTSPVGALAEIAVQFAGDQAAAANTEQVLAQGAFELALRPFFEPAMDEHSQARQRLERDLRHAIELEQMQLYYQPVVSCVTGDLVGFEALLRWNHPELGLVPPLDFIPLAEKIGLIEGIGQWVIETACEAAAGWKDPHWVSVNVSPIQFRVSDLGRIVGDALDRSGLPAGRLELEITEGTLMEDPKRADVMSLLRERGVRIALDDFGTGYSGLGYLQKFRIDKLKIDRSFIARLGEADDATIIVRAIVGMAHNLGLAVTAEGVETPEELAMVREFRCEEAQGFLLGRPLPMGAASQLPSARVGKVVADADPPLRASGAIPIRASAGNPAGAAIRR
jgi:EAL domain-containing protein (putative c-di-GMP-specific phosphodiesterase class I)